MVKIGPNAANLQKSVKTNQAEQNVKQEAVNVGTNTGAAPKATTKKSDVPTVIKDSDAPFLPDYTFNGSPYSPDAVDQVRNYKYFNDVK